LWKDKNPVYILLRESQFDLFCCGGEECLGA